MPALQPSIIFISLITVLSVVEFIWRTRSGRGYDVRAFGGTIGVMAGRLLIKGLFAGVIGAVMLAVFSLAPVAWPLDDWRTWLVGFVVVEFLYYWQHRFSHTVRWFWASHAVHHSPNEFTLPAAVRLGWTGEIAGNWVIYLPMVLLGFHPILLATLLTVNLQYQYFLHTEAVGRLGPLEGILNTPSSHRVHHGSNPAYLDKNFGGILIIFDRMFGTYEAERADERVTYGLTTPLRSSNPFVIALHEWANMFGDLRRARSIEDGIRALVGRPGSASASTASLRRPLPDPAG